MLHSVCRDGNHVCALQTSAGPDDESGAQGTLPECSRPGCGLRELPGNVCRCQFPGTARGPATRSQVQSMTPALAARVAA